MKTYEPWLDRELTDLIRDQPELVAIADALAQADGRTFASRSRRLPRKRALASLFALAAVVVAALVVPWRGSHGGGLADRALAAVGNEPVLHVVIEQPSDQRLVDLTSGESRDVEVTSEIWYDRAKGLVHSLGRSGDVVVGDELQTPHGSYSETGPVIDCAWIAAHPLEATKLRVSCNANGHNGTKPRTIPRPTPTIDPPLAAFLDGYRDAVARGAAHKIAGPPLDGRRVVWLAFPFEHGRSEDAALDPETYKPLLVRMPGGGYEYRIHSIESLNLAEANFDQPKRDPRALPIGSGGVFERIPVALSRAALARLYPHALWAGEALDGLPLISIVRDRLTSRLFGGRIERGFGVRLTYGSAKAGGRPNWSRPFIEVFESDHPQPAYRWGFVRGALPPRGEILLPSASGRSFGFIVDHAVYVSISGRDDAAVIAAGRALEPLVGQH